VLIHDISVPSVTSMLSFTHLSSPFSYRLGTVSPNSLLFFCFQIGTFGLSANGFFSPFFVTHVNILTFDRSHSYRISLLGSFRLQSIPLQNTLLPSFGSFVGLANGLATPLSFPSSNVARSNESLHPPDNLPRTNSRFGHHLSLFYLWGDPSHLVRCYAFIIRLAASKPTAYLSSTSHSLLYFNRV